MGLSSSSSKTTSNSSQNTNQNENMTTSPVTPDWLSQAAQDYVGRIGAFGEMDPNQFVAPGSPLQQAAWQNAGSLGDWRQQTATASQLAQQAGSQAPNYAGFAALRAQLSPQLSGGGGAQAAADALGGEKLMRSSNLAAPASAFAGAAAQPGPAFTYEAPTVRSPAAPTAYGAQRTTLAAPGLVSGAGYTAPQLGNAQGYAAARIGTLIGAAASTWQAPAIGNAPAVSGASYTAGQVNGPAIAPISNASAASANPASLLSDFSAYQNPYQQQVIDASLADFDRNALKQQAQLEAQGARNGALGGSRFGIAQGELLSDQNRSRAQLDAGLRQQGFETAAGLSQADAANRQAASLFNAQNQTGVSSANAAAANQRALSQAGLDLQGALANQQAFDTAAQFGANSGYEAGLANAQLGAARDQLQAQLQAQAASQNAAGLSQASQFNAGQGLQAALAQAGLDSDAAKYLAETGNQYGLQQAGLNAAAGQFNAANAQQAALANQALGGQYGLAQFGADTQAAQNYAAALNQAGLTDYQGLLGNAQLQAQLAAQAGQYNAGANNQMAQFDAGQADNAANRQLQAAQLLGGLANDYGTGTRADLATMAQLGDQQRGIEQAYAMAGPAQLQLMGQLSGMTPYDILVGRNVNGTTNGTMTQSGTQITNQTPSLFNQLLAAGQVASSFIP